MGTPAVHHTAAFDFDVLVVGAGPCGLAVAARLVRDCRAEGLDERALLARTRVLDPAGAWLRAWRSKLAVQNVRTLRSPSFVHPHPTRVLDDALRVYARAHGRERELVPLEAASVAGSVVGSEAGSEAGSALAKVAGWAAPSVALFADFCESVVDEYSLRELVLAATVVRVRPCGRGAVLKLGDGSELSARFVVLALGGVGAPRVPEWAGALISKLEALGAAESWALESDKGDKSDKDAMPRVVHVSAMRGNGAPVAGTRREKGWQKRLLIVGGGLSAAQLVLKATERVGEHWDEVVLCTRAPLVVRPFDIGTEWMSRHWEADFCDSELKFYCADPAERLKLLKVARPGGSVTPEVFAEIQAREKEQKSAPSSWWYQWLTGGGGVRPRLVRMEGYAVVGAEFESASRRIRLHLHKRSNDEGSSQGQGQGGAPQPAIATSLNLRGKQEQGGTGQGQAQTNDEGRSQGQRQGSAPQPAIATSLNPREIQGQGGEAYKRQGQNQARTQSISVSGNLNHAQIQSISGNLNSVRAEDFLVDAIWLATGQVVSVSGGLGGGDGLGGGECGGLGDRLGGGDGSGLGEEGGEKGGRSGLFETSYLFEIFESLQRHWPTEVIGGLPVLTPSLQWANDAPIFICGYLSALQVCVFFFFFFSLFL